VRAARPARETRHVAQPTKFVAVFGDAFADELAKGLSDALSGHPEIGIALDVDPKKGLLDHDTNWRQMAGQIRGQGAAIVAVVVMLGATAQPGGGAGAGAADSSTGPAASADDEAVGPSPAPGPSPWVDLYAARMDGLMRALREGGTPVIWVGLPPVEDPAASADNAAVNRLVRQRVTALGGVFVDPWNSFVGEDGTFARRGPDADGNVVPLRSADGTHFTDAGARKLAQIVAAELRPMLAPKGSDAAVAAAVRASAQPHPPGTSRIILLNAPPRSPGAALLPPAPPAAAADADLALAKRALVQGLPVPARTGRADDYAWPPAGR
jgi:hypothetical protein